MKLSAKKVEDAIGILKNGWPGRCHQIASKLLDSGLVPESYKLRYGHWLGPIDNTPSEHNPFAGQKLAHHGWLQDGDTIIDPTRWVFEGLPPRRAYIFIGTDSDGYYSEDSNKPIDYWLGQVTP